MNSDSSFQLTAAMNLAFGNPKGDPDAIDWDRIRSQCLNIPDEFGELMIALGADKTAVKAAVAALKASCTPVNAEVDEYEARDSISDIHIFGYGAHHLMGFDGDDDNQAVVEGVMTRFIKDDADKAASIAMHAAAGITEVYFEGEYPTMVMKSACDQPDAPKGKFLKSASYRRAIFRRPKAV